MSTVGSATASEALFASNPNSADKNQIEATQDRFLSLLIAQMKNQDPLNPLDNAQVTSQMAQLSTVQGIEKMNASLETLAASLASGQAAQAANLIGHVVLAPGNQVTPAEDANVIGFELPYGVDSLTATVTDASGNVVRTMNLGARDGGIGMAAWDGLTDQGTAAAPGQYSFSLEAVQGGRQVDATPLALGQVSSVFAEAGKVQLDLGLAGTTAYEGVRRIY
jgi:flagellar basal-body rod modification protein FlgD